MYIYILMKKIILLFTYLLSFQSFAIDIQNKMLNSDKSYFETISTPDVLEKYQSMFFLNYSLLKNPVLDENNKPYIDGLQDINASFLYGLFNKTEIGLTVSYKDTLVNENSFYEKYQGLSDGIFEVKYKLFENLSIIPQYIFPLHDQVPLGGVANSGYGLKLSGSLFKKSKLPFFINLAGYNFNENKLNNIDQSSRIFASLGTIYNLNEYFDLGVEYFHDQAENHSPKELLTHLTFDNQSLLLRSGFGFGLNEHDQNEFRFFLTLGFNFDFSSENKRKRNELNNEFLIRSINSVEDQENVKMEDNNPKIKNMMKESSLTDTKEEKYDEHNVIPFYTVKEIKKIKKEEPVEEKKEEKELKHQKLVDKKFDRLVKSYDNLNYFVDLHKNKEISDKKALVEFSWGLRVIKMRRETLDDIRKNIKNVDDYEKLNKYKNEKEFEEYAKNFVNENYKKLKKIRKDLKEKSSEKEVVVKKVEKKKETRKDKNKEKLTLEQIKIKEEQEKAWEISKTKTLQDLIKEGKKKSTLVVKKEIVKKSNDKKNILNNPEKKEMIVENSQNQEVEIISKTEDVLINESIDEKEDSIVNAVKKKEYVIPSIESLSSGLVKSKDEQIKEKKESLLDKINKKLEINVKSDYKYNGFINQYKEKLNIAIERKNVAKEKEVNEIIINKFKELQKVEKVESKDPSNGSEKIKLQEYKIISVDQVNEEKEQEVKDEFLNDFYEKSNTYDDAVIYEEGDIEKSLGPRY